MPLTPGTRLGSYEIVAKLGEGGMGEVYRAKDTRLGRSAAIKTLPPEFAHDADRRARFEREAKTLATLNHPHIAQIYGLEDLPGDDGTAALALVMELVEGEDLAQRLSRGPVPLDEVWPLARQIAEGLEAAHEAGIVHRDLKPANIRVTPDGTVKVLDFGLAKPMEPVGVSAQITHSPTLTSPALTTRGVVLGTASYMAPEQAKGKPVDRRADIWAFGCVLYELLTATRAFEGEDVPEILGAIIKSEPDWTTLPAATPAPARAVLRRCLMKDRTERWQHIGDVRLALAESLLAPASAEPPSQPTRWSRAGWVVATIAGAAAAAMAFGAGYSAPALAPVAGAVQFELPIQGRFALSPDGSQLAYLLADRAASTLWLRDFAAPQPRELGATDGGAWLEWLPDGSAIFVAAQEGRRRFTPATKVVVRERSPSDVILGTRVAGGATAVLPDGRMIVGATTNATDKRLLLWSPTGDSVFLELDTSAGEVRQAHPTLWADDLLSYASVRANDSRFLCVTPISRPAPRCVGPLDQAAGTYYQHGRVIYSRERSLFSRGIDLTTLTFTSNEEPLADDLALYTTAALPRLSVTAHTMAFAVGNGGDTLEWRAPREAAAPIVEIEFTTNFSLSPDGTRVLSMAGGSLLLTTLATGSSARLGLTGGDVIWAPDGRRMAHRGLAGGLNIRSVDSDRQEQLLPVSTVVYPEDWSNDGRWIAAVAREGPARLLLIPVDGGEPVIALPAGGDIGVADEAHFSPDGRWLAFNAVSGERDEVFVVPVPPTGQRWQVSTEGGVQARWHPRGGMLYYAAPDGAMMAVRVGSSRQFDAGPPQKLFDLGFAPARQSDDYRVAPDGRFLVKRPAPGRVRVIVDWASLLRPPASASDMR